MKQIQLEVVTPHKKILEKLVDKIALPGLEGEMGILPEHIPLLTVMDTGILSYTLDENTHSIAVHDGYAQVDGKSVRILVEIVEYPDEIDLERAKRAELNSKKQLNPSEKNNDSKESEDKKLKYERKLKRSIIRQRLALMK